MRHSILALACAMLLLAASTVPVVTAQTSGPDYDLPGGIGHFYTQTNGGAGAQYGYRITNEGGINFWSEFQRLGGVPALGYPVSRRFTLDGFTVQATQKVIMQWRPDTNPPQVYFVNVFDKLHQLGLDGVLRLTYQIPPQLDPSFDAGKTADQAAKDRLALLDADPVIAARYRALGALATLYAGLPTSKVTNEGPFVALRTQRLAIQHWTVDNPAAGIKAGDVTVVNGGDIAKQLGLVPAAYAAPETVGGVPASMPAQSPPPPSVQPAAGPQPTATPLAYAWYFKKVTEPPSICGPGQAFACLDSAPNLGSQYISGHVFDKTGNPVSGIIVEAQGGGKVLYGTSDSSGLFDILLSSGCPTQSTTYQVFVVDGGFNRSSYAKTINYTNCAAAGEFHFDFVQAS